MRNAQETKIFRKVSVATSRAWYHYRKPSKANHDIHYSISISYFKWKTWYEKYSKI